MIPQSLHSQWKEIGPVAKEVQEETWNRFKEVTDKINNAYHRFFDNLREEQDNNLKIKEEICVKLENYASVSFEKLSEWNVATDTVLALQTEWKHAGTIPLKERNRLYKRYRAACDAFFERKRQYFQDIQTLQNKNLTKKIELCEKVEALKDSTDWGTTTKKIIEYQKEWKTIGPVPKKHSDTIWKRFISACDYFFEQKNKQTASVRQVEQENLLLKKAVIEKLNALDEAMAPSEAVALVKTLMAEWNQIGHVPFKEKDKIYKSYQAALDKHFKRLNMNETKNRLNSFTSAVQQMASSDQAQNKLYRERERLMRSYEHVKAELQTYENNMGFLNISSKSGGGMLKEMERKMQKLKDEMQLIAQKIELIDENL